MGENSILRILLAKRIDAANSDIELRRMNDIISSSDCSIIELDASEMEYISSAGLRVLLSIKKNSRKSLQIVEVSNDVYDIFDVTGFNQLLDVKKRMRKVSVDGCEIIGSGFSGNVYRLDPETIIKVYENDIDENILKTIENEKNMAKLALIGGIPTAISYDIVKVGDNYGAIFELLNAECLNTLIIKNPGDAEKYTKVYVDFLKIIHNTEIESPLIMSAKEKFYGYLDAVKDYMDDNLYLNIKQLISTINESHNVVHGDPHMKNIMMVDGELMLIDMDTLCVGNLIFDLQALYVTYILFGEDEPDNSMKFLGIEKKMADSIWDWVIKYYFADMSDEEIGKILDKIYLLAYVRFLQLVVTSSLLNSDLGQIRVRHTTEKLSVLCKKCSDLNI